MDFAGLKQNIETVNARIEKACQKSGRRPHEVTLVVVTKTHPVETLQALIDVGIRDIGENRVQELSQKVPFLKGDFSMHMVGHLQTNKVSKVLPFITWVQSVDRAGLVEKIASVSKDAAGVRKLKVLVEVNTSAEASKSGCLPGECRALCEMVAAQPSMELHGLMTVGPLIGGQRASRRAFETLRRLGEQCRDLTSGALSMGMSADFDWAIEEGATMIRIGSLILGQRR